MPLLETPSLTIVQGPVLSKSSHLDLRFSLDAGCTRMAVPAQQPPWRVIRAFQNSQSQAVVHLHNVSGGILSGDALHLLLDAGPCTRSQITSVGATRIYRLRPERETARIVTNIRVGDEAMLEYLPDVVIPFANSSCRQSTIVSLGSNAGFIGWETLSAGRIACGEAFEFRSFDSEYSISSATRPLALERYSLEPALRDHKSAARWGRFHYSASLYICHTGVQSSRWLDLESTLNNYAFSETTSASRWGVSTLIASGIVVRGLALEAHQITAKLHTFWNLAKQELWGQPAIAPRKIN
jgi:urease accessory protein